MKIALIGCGWLGQPLAERLIKQGHVVYGTTTRLTQLCLLEDINVTPFLFNIYDAPLSDNALEQLRACDVFIINIPPRRRTLDKDLFVNGIKALVNAITVTNSHQQLNFLSTTSVFGNLQGECDEATPVAPETSSGKAHAEIEQWLLDEVDNSNVLRLAGLVAEDRHPITSIVQRDAFSNGQQLVNLVHRSDVITALLALIKSELTQHIFHLCAPEHPTRSAYYRAAAEQRGLPFPVEIHNASTNAQGKCIVGDISRQILKFTYRYPSPFDML